LRDLEALCERSPFRFRPAAAEEPQTADFGDLRCKSVYLTWGDVFRAVQGSS
jgi:hypothetical protein